MRIYFPKILTSKKNYFVCEINDLIYPRVIKLLKARHDIDGLWAMAQQTEEGGGGLAIV